MEEIDLVNVGLTQNESKVYTTLVKRGASTSTELSARSTVPYGRIYDVLGGLIQRGLVSIIPGKNKKFSATSPEELLKLIEGKEQDLLKTKEGISELKKFYEQKEEDAVRVAYGDKGFWKLASEMHEPKKYGYSVRWKFRERGGNTDRMKKRIKRGIALKELVNKEQENPKELEKLKKVNKQVRAIRNNGVAIAIQDDEEVLIALIKSNMSLLVKDRSFAEMMKKMFEETYKSAGSV